MSENCSDFTDFSLDDTRIKLSVIVPVKNTAPYLRECLDSILNQTMPEIEILCIENGSTDNSLEILEEYQRDHQNIHVQVCEHGRLGDARNKGMKAARGEYIGFVDSDDLIRSEMYQEMVEKAVHLNADMAVCGIMVYNQKKDIYFEKEPEIFRGNPSGSIERNRKLFRNLTAWNKIYKREFLRKNGITFPEDLYYEDHLFVISAYILANRIVQIEKPHYIYRKQRPGQISMISTFHLLDIFKIYGLVDSFVLNNDKAKRFSQDIAEAKIRSLLYLFNYAKKSVKKDFYYWMKRDFMKSSITEPPLSCTHTELKSFRIIRRHGYLTAVFILAMREMMGRLLYIPQVKKGFLALKKISSMTISA